MTASNPTRPPRRDTERPVRLVWIWALVLTLVAWIAGSTLETVALERWVLVVPTAAFPFVVFWRMDRNPDPRPFAGLAFGCVFVLLGTVAVASDLAWELESLKLTASVIGVEYALFGLGLTMRYGPSFLEVPPNRTITDVERSVFLFNKHLVLLGALLVLLGILNGVVLSGLTRVAALGELTRDDPFFHANVARLLLLSVGNSVLGALFFVANSCREKRKELEKQGSSVAFVSEHFWGGLWFRVGEAIVFTLLVFLFLQVVNSNAVDEAKRTQFNFIWLPVVSLLMGMFVKPSERIIKGLRDRVFAMVEALVPASSSVSGESAERTKSNTPIGGAVDAPAAPKDTDETHPKGL